MTDLMRHALAVAQLIRELRHALNADLPTSTRLVRVRAALYRYDTMIAAGSGQPADTAGRDSRRGPATAAVAPTPAADAPARDASSPSGVPGHPQVIVDILGEPVRLRGHGRPDSQLAAAPTSGWAWDASPAGRNGASADAGKPAAPTDEHHPLPGAGGPAGARDGCRWCHSGGLATAVCVCLRNCGSVCAVRAGDDTLVVPRPATDPALLGRPRHAAADDAPTVVLSAVAPINGRGERQ